MVRIWRILASSVFLVSTALAQPAAPSTSEFERRIAELEKKMKEIDPSFGAIPPKDMAERLAALERKMAEVMAARTPAPVAPPTAPVAPQPPVVASVVPAQPAGPGPGLQSVSITGDYQRSADAEVKLPVSGYMDFHVNKDRGNPFSPDFHRFVLLFGHSFSDRIKFWSELELEHSLVEGGTETGEVALEQAYVDFLWKPALSFRAGMLLSPVGIVNERHEPPSFHGVERPFVETIIIPTTWRELGAGITGDLGRGFRYRAYVTSSLNAAFFNAEFGIAEGKTSGFEASLRNPAKVGRLEYNGIRRLLLGTSVYTGHAGFDTPGINPNVNIYNFDGRYTVGRWDLRGLFAKTWVSQTAELNEFLERRTGVNPNVAEQMQGWYLEPAFHLTRRRFRNDFAVFTRYENYDTQHKMAPGFEPINEFRRSSWFAGLTYKPVPDVAIKFDYVWNRNKSQFIKPVDGINLGIGWWF